MAVYARQGGFRLRISVAPTSFGVADTTARIVFRHPPEAIKAIELLDGKWFGESNIHGKNLSCKINGATDVTTNYDYCQPNQFRQQERAVREFNTREYRRTTTGNYNYLPEHHVKRVMSDKAKNAELIRGDVKRLSVSDRLSLPVANDNIKDCLTIDDGIQVCKETTIASIKTVRETTVESKPSDGSPQFSQIFDNETVRTYLNDTDKYKHFLEICARDKISVAGNDDVSSTSHEEDERAAKRHKMNDNDVETERLFMCDGCGCRLTTLGVLSHYCLNKGPGRY